MKVELPPLLSIMEKKSQKNEKNWPLPLSTAISQS